MTELELEKLREQLKGFSSQGRTALLPALYAAQDIFGYIPAEAASAVGNALGVPLADVFGVIDFYALFYREPVSKIVVHVCGDPVCALAGSEGIMKMMSQRIEPGRLPGQLPSVAVERAPCLGLCEHAPAIMVQGAPAARADMSTYEDLVSGNLQRPHTVLGSEISLLTSNCGHGHTTWLKEYEHKGGYQGLRKALTSTPEGVIAEVKVSGLVGRGGAAFPTGLKWESAEKAPGTQKYIICNADEAEPGTFKDRVMLEDDPHRILEGLLIGAFAIGASKGYIYIRGEYNYARNIINQAAAEARRAGIFGENILDSGFSFDVEIRRGAGAYVCGEETAQFESIEGKRGLPRVKPPFPTTYGLFGMPTVINNVETLCNIPGIIAHGAAEYRRYGTEKSPGSKLFCVSGDVIRPGLYEVPFGVTAQHLIYDLVGGIRGGHTVQAVLFGGAAGAFGVEADLQVRLSFEDMRTAGLPLGSGGITVFDETRDMRDVLVRLAHFFAEESCGKCYPCQLGTQRQYEIMQRISEGHALKGDFERLSDIGATMTDSSLCGLGQTASSAILSAMRLFPKIFNPVSKANEVRDAR